MAPPRLKTKLWVQAQLRLCDQRNISAVVLRKGDEDAGAVLVKLDRRDLGCTVYTQIRTSEGEAAWLAGTGKTPVTSAEADAYIARQVGRDWDLWVLEIDDREGRLPEMTVVEG